MDEGAEKLHELSLDLPAAHSAERMARTVLRQFARRESVAKSEIETLEFVASELLSNAVDHGGGERAMEESDLPRRVRMKLFVTVDAKGWRMQVTDEGGGDPKDVERLIAQHEMPDLEDERGRGFFLLTQMLESLAVEKSPDGRGLVFTAVRRYEQPRS
jgi:anti-sigma regulatory factor (Ser/Thr protein kinase)